LAGYNRREFEAYLQHVKNQEPETAKDNGCFVQTFCKSGKSPVDFINSYSKPNSYNNALNALKHYCDFLGVARPALKQKRRSPDKLIIAPKPDEVKGIFTKLLSPDVKAYIALCATVGLRPQRLLKATWSEIDFVNGWVNINERHGKKVYRPNKLHKDVAILLQQLKTTSTSQRVFTFGYK
jgi:integrase